MPKYRRGSGSVYKRGKTWWIAYYGPDGKQVCESAKTKDKAEARNTLQSKIGQRAEGRLVVGADKVTFDDLADMILTDYKVNGKKSFSDVQTRIKQHLTPFFAGKKAQEITSVTVQAYVARRLEQGASNGTVNRELAALKRAFNLALQAEKIIRKPHFPMLAENNVRQGFFERAEFEAILARLPDYMRPPVTFAYQIGWRIGSEVLPLQWRQVDLETGTVRLEVGTTKNKGGRLIYLTRELRDMLEAQWQDHIDRYPECPFVFHRQGKRIPSVQKPWEKARLEAGLPDKISHDFRRTAVRNMVRAGIPERVAMQISGHKTRAIFDRYHIVSDGDLREAAKKLDGALSPQTTTISTTMPPETPLTH